MNNQYKQLTLKERYQIQALKELGFSARKIAYEMKRSNKTISNELTRCLPDKYDAKVAHEFSDRRRRQAKKSSKVSDELSKKIKWTLEIGCSPEQIAGRMRLENIATICTNTIYRFIKASGWRTQLPRKGKPYKQRQSCLAGAHLIPDRRDIDERPAVVEAKEEIGHWEGDTVHGQDGYLVTLTERVTKILLCCRVRNKTKKAVANAVKTLLKPFKHRCKTITFDNGGEFADHKKIAKALQCDIYFAKPYHSWQRGLNENTNGLLRRFFPKGMRIMRVSIQDLKAALILINMRPRKTLDFKTPIEVLYGKSVSVIAAI